MASGGWTRTTGRVGWIGWLTMVVAGLAMMVAPSSGTVFDDTAQPSWQLQTGSRARAITSANGVVYVGGDFSSINDGIGGPPVNQSRLAAFDATTGDWIPAFQPQLNGVVHALEATADGSRLFAGGTFTQVNGASISGVVELDPVTGATVSSLDAGTSGAAYGLALTDTHLYVAGNLTRVGSVVVVGAGRMTLATGSADAAWTPTLSSGSARAVAPLPELGTVFLGGFFTTANGDPTDEKLVAVDDVTGATMPFFDPGAVEEVFDLAATADKLYIAHGGPGGRADVRDPVDGHLIASRFTDGDVQSVEVSGDRVYFGHHGELVDGVAWPWVFAMDRADDSVDTGFLPGISAADGIGVWAVHDEGPRLWVGGGIDSITPVGGVGFARFPAAAAQPDDTVAPSTPTGLVATVVADTFVALDWDDASDDSGALYYRVLSDGVFAGTSSTSDFMDVTASADTSYTYAVEAVDAAQNSAVSASIAVQTLPSLTELVPVTMGGTWRYLDDAVAADGWELTGFDDSGWAIGAGELGAGDGDETTVIAHPPGPSVTTYFRTEFDVPVGNSVAVALFEYLRDDGILVRVNGVEVLRDNLPAGPIDETTRASTWLSGTLESTVELATLDPAAFVQGTNVLSVELHNASSGSDMSFDAGLELGLVSSDEEAPSDPTALTVGAVTEHTVTLSWQPSTDNVAVTGYDVVRDGSVVATVGSAAYIDVNLSPDTSYGYVVRARDAAGNVSGDSNPVSATTNVGSPQDPLVVPFGSVWAYDDTGVYPGATWADNGFDDAAWATGAAHLGAGDGDEATVVVNRPTLWLRSEFDVVDPALVTSIELGVVADDGAVVFLNGVEVVRDNVDPGPVDGSTAASSYRWGPAESAVNSFSVAPSALVPGTNVVAVALVNGPGSSDSSFDLEVILELAAEPDVNSPSQVVGLAASNVGATSLQLDWTPATDDVGVAGYDLFRDGALVATVATPGFGDSGLAPSTAYSYAVEAFDAAGNRGARSVDVIATTAAGPPVESELLALGSSWRYLDSGSYPGAAWADTTFDDITWSVGNAPLAALDPGATSLVNQPTVWLRSDVVVVDSGAVVQLEADVRADDGVVVFANGVEAMRDNVGAGPVDGSTSASSYRWGAAETQLRTFTLPVGALVDGNNVIAVALVNGPGSSDSSFDLRLRQFVQP